MSPGVMRLIFGGFAILMLGVAVNTLLLQPDMTPALAKAMPAQAVAAKTATATNPPLTSTTHTAVPPPSMPIREASVRGSSVRDAAARAPHAELPQPPAEPIRTARLATDSAQPLRMPHLPEAEGDPDVILRVQKELLSRGYGPVVANGIIGPLSRAAIMAYEHDNALPITGEATEVLLKRMRDGTAANRQPGAEARKIRSPEAEQVVRTVQHSLTTLGYEPGRITGRVSDETERAIRAFETAHKLEPSGRVSAELFSLLARAIGARSAKVSP